MFSSSRKKIESIPMVHELDKLFKHFQEDEGFDFTKKDFDNLKPEDHAYAL